MGMEEKKKKIKFIFDPNSDVLATGYNQSLGNYTIKNDPNDDTLLQQLLRNGNNQNKISVVMDKDMPLILQRLYAN